MCPLILLIVLLLEILCLIELISPIADVNPSKNFTKLGNDYKYLIYCGLLNRLQMFDEAFLLVFNFVERHLVNYCLMCPIQHPSQKSSPFFFNG